MGILKGVQRIHFVGIGGIGASGLARLLFMQGKDVSGSDLTATELTRDLSLEGIEVKIGHLALPEVDILIYSEAVPGNDPQRLEAKERGIPEMNYFEALGEFVEDYRVIAVAGTHGKTTTATMLALILIAADYDPTVLVGTKVKELEGKNMRMGASDFFLVEACEYRRDFLTLSPALLGVTNMEFDHMDYFKDYADYHSAFEELSEQCEEVIWPDDYSEFEGDLKVPGNHNLMNAGLAAHMARRLGVPEGIISSTLEEFTGTWRRFEYKGELNGAIIIDDYAHHPTEIRATIQAAEEEYPERRIVAVFQPHQFSRTIALIDEFAASFEGASEVIIPNIYAVRDSEADKNALTAKGFVETISKHHMNAKFIDGLEATAAYLKESLSEDDVLLVMGAGPIDAIYSLLFY
jgi:UDP-N-acetylmuramate--alanine ligase